MTISLRTPALHLRRASIQRIVLVRRSQATHCWRMADAGIELVTWPMFPPGEYWFPGWYVGHAIVLDSAGKVVSATLTCQ